MGDLSEKGFSMYNEELKNKFIEECTNGKAEVQRASRLFSLAEPFENEWKRDICTIPATELGDALETITSARLGAQSVDMSILRKYARWCMHIGVEGACDGLMISQDVGYEKLRATMVDSPERLQRNLDMVFHPVSDCRPDNLCRGLYWLAYMGFDNSEVSKITTESVDLKNLVIRFGGKSYPIYEASVPVIRYLCSANSFICDFVRCEAVVERDGGTLLLRGMRSGSGANIDSIERLALRRISAYNKASTENVSIRYRGIRYSGIFYRMFQDETNGVDIDAAAGKYLKFYFSNSDSLHEKRIARKELELITDYRRWKIAFNK